jgi:hypothetical protein
VASQRFRQCETNLARAREVVGLGESIFALSAGRLDPADLFRSALVQGVASLDTYVHGVVLDHGVEILLGRRQAGSSSKVGFHFGIVSDLLHAPTVVERELRARTHVAQRLGLETFQKPESIAQAFAMVGIAKVWSTAFGGEAEATMLRLSLIVRRRNEIVHSCDVDPVMPGNYRPLSSADAVKAVDDISDIVSRLDPVVA